MNVMKVMTMALAVAGTTFGATVAYNPAVHGNPIVVTTDEAVTIDGNGATIDGGGKARCATLGPNVTLKNFTLKNGSAQVGGGVLGGRLVNCTVTGCTATESGAALANCVADGCTLANNRMTASDSGAAVHGGIVQASTLTGCRIAGNSAAFGPGAPAFGGLAAWSTVSGCVLEDNSATSDEGVCYGRRFAYSTVNGNYVEFDDGDMALDPDPGPGCYGVVFLSGDDRATGSTPRMVCSRGRVYALSANGFSLSVNGIPAVFRGWRCLENGKLYDDRMLVFDLMPERTTAHLQCVWELRK